MNFSTFEQTYNFSDNFTDTTKDNPVFHFKDFEPDKPMKSVRQVYRYQNKDKNINSSKNINEKAIMATKGILGEKDIDPVTDLFYSDENIRRIQKLIKQEIYNRSGGKYKLEENQEEADLLVSMKAVFFDENNGCRFLPNKIKRQVKKLNNAVVEYIVPNMISNIKQYYGYLKDINGPIEPMLRPMNVNNAGRKTLPSITTIWGS
jgi:tyrosyl-tRNA synthetase